MEYFAIAAGLALVLIVCAHLFSKKEKPEIVKTGYSPYHQTPGSSGKGSMSAGAGMSREDYEKFARSQKRSMADSQKRNSSDDDDGILAGVVGVITSAIDFDSGSSSSSDCGSSDSGDSGGGDCGGGD